MTIAEFTLFSGAVRIAGDVQLRSRWHASDGYLIAIGNDGNVTVRLPRHEWCTMFALSSGYLAMVADEVADGPVPAAGAPDNGVAWMSGTEHASKGGIIFDGPKRGPGRPKKMSDYSGK